MKSRDFVYWLKGYFELIRLSSNLLILNKVQIEMVQKHLAMVFAHEVITTTPKAYGFCQWLSGCLDIMTVNNNDFLNEHTKMIDGKLDSIFEHEIDPSFKDKAILEKIHNSPQERFLPPDMNFEGQTASGPSQIFDYHNTRITC